MPHFRHTGCSKCNQNNPQTLSKGKTENSKQRRYFYILVIFSKSCTKEKGIHLKKICLTGVNRPYLSRFFLTRRQYNPKCSPKSRQWTRRHPFEVTNQLRSKMKFLPHWNRIDGFSPLLQIFHRDIRYWRPFIRPNRFGYFLPSRLNIHRVIIISMAQERPNLIAVADLLTV